MPVSLAAWSLSLSEAWLLAMIHVNGTIGSRGMQKFQEAIFLDPIDRHNPTQYLLIHMVTK